MKQQSTRYGTQLQCRKKKTLRTDRHPYIVKHKTGWQRERLRFKQSRRSQNDKLPGI